MCIRDSGHTGFSRAADGTITNFEVSGAASTLPWAINAAGTIAGDYNTSSDSGYRGFSRATDGAITTFEAPDAGTGETEGTFAYSINTAGDIAGTYRDATGVFHGYVRTP